MRAADSMLVCLFEGNGAETQIPLLDYDAGVWHGFVPGARAWTFPHTDRSSAAT